MPWLAGQSEDDYQTLSNRAGSGVKGLFQAAPMVAGAVYGFNQMVGNNPLSSAISRRNGIIDTTKSVGSNLTQMQAAATANKVAATEQFAGQITNSDHIGNVVRSGAEERKALIAGVLDQLDDALPANANIRQDLLKMLDMTDEVAAQEINAIQTKVSEGVEALKTGGGGYKQRLQRSIQSYKSISSQLVAPLGSVGSTGVAIETITRAKATSKISQQAMGLFNMLEQSLSKHTLNISHIDGGYYASGKVGKEAFHIPLQGETIGQGPRGSRVHQIRTGNGMATKYVGGQMYIDAEAVYNQFISKGSLPSRNLIDRSMISGSGAFVDYPTMIAREYAGLASKNGGELKVRDLRYAGSRIRALSTWAPNNNAKHVANQKLLASSTAHILNLENIPESARADFGARLSAAKNPVFDSAVSPQLANFEEPGYGNRISLKTRVSGFEGSTSPINDIRNLTGNGPIDRALLPVTARPRQVTNRENWFVPSGTRSTLGSGGSIKMYNQNLGFGAANLTNGINTAVLMKLGEPGQALGLTEGMAYWGGGNETVRTNLPRTVMSSGQRGAPSTALMNELIHRRNKGLGALTLGSRIETGLNAGKTIGSVDDFFNMYGVSSKGAPLGKNGDTIRYIPRQSDMANFSLQLGSDEMKGGFAHHKLVNSHIDTRFGTGKAFSGANKSTHINLTDKQFQETLQKFTGPMGAWSRDMGLNTRNTVINTGAMMKKAPHYLASQMVTSIGLIGGGNMDDIYAAAKSNLVSPTQGSEVARQRKYLHSAIEFTANQLGSKNAAPQMLGLAFGAASFAGSKGQFGLTTESVNAAIERGLKGTGHESKLGAVLKASRRHEAIGAFTMTPGARASEYKDALGSITGRSYQLLAHRMQNTLCLLYTSDAADE